MTGRETEFVPQFPLFFTHKGRRKLFELLGVRTQKEFMKTINEMERGEGISDEVYEKIIYAGLVWLGKDELTLENVPDLIETFYTKGHSSEDLENVIVDAYVNSGLYNRDVVETFRRMKKEQIDKAIKTIEGSDFTPMIKEATGGSPKNENLLEKKETKN